MAVVNVTGAQVANATWNLVSDEYHATGSVSLNATVVISLQATGGSDATPAIFRFDGAFILSSATSGRFQTIGTSATNRIRFQPNGAASTWSESTNVPQISHTFTGAPVLDFCDFYYIGITDSHTAGNASITNCRVYAALSTFNGSVLINPSAGTNTYRLIECHGGSHTSNTIRLNPTGGINTFDKLYVRGAASVTCTPTGGTSSYTNIKIVESYGAGFVFAGAQPFDTVYQNVSITECFGGIAGSSTGTLLNLSMFVLRNVGQGGIGVVPAAGKVHTFDDCYISTTTGTVPSVSTTAAVADLVVQNSVIATDIRIGQSVGTDAIVHATSSGNDVVQLSPSMLTSTGIRNGTSDNDYIAAVNGGFAGIVGPAAGWPVHGPLSDFGDPNFAINVDTDSGNTTSTHTRPGYRTLTANRTNPRSTPNKPTTISGVFVSAITSSGATFNFTTGIKAKSRIIFSTVSGVTPLNAEIRSPWKYGGFLDPDDPTDFSLPVTTHQHVLSGLLQPNTTYYYRVECIDPVNRRFMTSQNTATTATIAPLSVATTSLDAGQLTQVYHAEIIPSGGAAPYSQQISTGTLPAGLTIDSGTGTISGTPTGVGTTTFTVQVTDSLSNTATLATSITVNPAGASSRTKAVTGQLVGMTRQPR